MRRPCWADLVAPWPLLSRTEAFRSIGAATTTGASASSAPPQQRRPVARDHLGLSSSRLLRSGCSSRLMERQLTTGLSVAGGRRLDDCQHGHAELPIESPWMGWATTSRRWQLQRTSSGWSSFDLGRATTTPWYGVWGPPGGPWDFVGNLQGGVRINGVLTFRMGDPIAPWRAWRRAAPSRWARPGWWGNCGPTAPSAATAARTMSTCRVWGSRLPGRQLALCRGSGGAVWTERNGGNFSSVPGVSSADLGMCGSRPRATAGW